MTATNVLTGVERPVGPCAVVIFGATGDLTRRKLLPALYNLKATGLLPRLQYLVYVIGVIVLGTSLYLMLDGNTALTPIVAGASLVTFAGVLLFAVIIFMPAKG